MWRTSSATSHIFPYWNVFIAFLSISELFKANEQHGNSIFLIITNEVCWGIKRKMPMKEMEIILVIHAQRTFTWKFLNAGFLFHVLDSDSYLSQIISVEIIFHFKSAFLFLNTWIHAGESVRRQFATLINCTWQWKYYNNICNLQLAFIIVSWIYLRLCLT